MEELTGVDVMPESKIFHGLKDAQKSKSPEKKNQDEVMTSESKGDSGSEREEFPIPDLHQGLGQEAMSPDQETAGFLQGCHNGRFWMKMSVRTSADAHPRPHLPANAVKTASARMQQCVRADAHIDLHGRIFASARTWGVRADAPPSPPLSFPPPPPLPPSPLLSPRLRGREKNKNKK
jgi:hypothetical protein